MHKKGGGCPFCGYDELQRKVVTKTFEYKGKKFEYSNYVIYECPKCGESVADKQTMKESSRAIRDFYRNVDGLLTSDEIHRIRHFKLCMTQDKASELLGGGAKSFARYENCEIIQSEAMDNLLRILDAYPHAIEVIKNKNKPRQEVVLSISGIFGAGSHAKLKAKVANYEQ